MKSRPCDRLQRIWWQKHKVLVLAHSYGGIVASEAITMDLYIATSQDSRKGVAYIVYLSAWLLQPGEEYPLHVCVLSEGHGYYDRVAGGYARICEGEWRLEGYKEQGLRALSVSQSGEGTK